MLDDLRRSTTERNIDDFDPEDDTLFLDEEPSRDRPFLGLSPVERMFLAIFVFMNVCVIGAGLLLATGRLVF
jgi:hypothetical protein